MGLYTNATMHTPIEVTKDALKKAQELKADVCVRESRSLVRSASQG